MSQPEALRLADLWEKHSHGYARTPEARTAAELRRLHAQRDALLKTMKWLDRWMGAKPMTECSEKVRAALKKAEEA